MATTSSKSSGVRAVLAIICIYIQVGALSAFSLPAGTEFPIDLSGTDYAVITSGSCESQGLVGIYTYQECQPLFAGWGGSSVLGFGIFGMSDVAGGCPLVWSNGDPFSYMGACHWNMDFSTGPKMVGLECMDGEPTPTSESSQTQTAICKGALTASVGSVGSVSGDPIVHVHGQRVKFDLPFATRTLLWKDNAISVFAKADVFTPDKKNQWFSDIEIVLGGKTLAQIQRRKLKLTTKEAPGALNTLSVTKHDIAGNPTLITSAGSYSLGDGVVVLRVANDGKTVGHLKREVVTVTSKLFHFSVSPQIATKFVADAGKALKYSHLDLTMQKMEGAEDGVLAEFFGLVPMSLETARSIRSLRTE